MRAFKPLQRDTEESPVDVNIVKNGNQASSTLEVVLEVLVDQFPNLLLLKAKRGQSRANGDDAWHVSAYWAGAPKPRRDPFWATTEIS